MDKKPTYTKPSANKKTIKKEGVIYTPSNDNIQKTEQSIPTKKTPVRKVPHKKSASTLIFIFATIVVGILGGTVTMALLFNTIWGGDGILANPSTSQNTNSNLVIEPIVQEIEQRGVAVIRSVDTVNRTITLYNINDDETQTLNVGMGTIIKNRFGETLVFAELRVGDIIDIGFESESGTLTSISINSQATELANVSNVQVDTQNNLITIGNHHYFYSDLTMSVYNGEPYNIADISSVDVITAKAFQNKIYHIVVHKSHGSISFANKDRVHDGSVEINTNIRLDLETAESIELTEGSHKIVVKGSNIDTFITEINLNKGEHYEIDLSQAQLRSGYLTINVNVEDAKLLINDNEEEIGEPLMLIHGEYTIHISKDGFNPHEETIEFDEAELTITVQLEEIEEEIEEEEEIEIVIPTKSINITTDPGNAEVFVDGQFVGITPLTIEVPYGNRTIIFRKDGYIETTHVEYVERSSSSNLFFILQTRDLLIPAS